MQHPQGLFDWVDVDVVHVGPVMHIHQVILTLPIVRNIKVFSSLWGMRCKEFTIRVLPGLSIRQVVLYVHCPRERWHLASSSLAVDVWDDLTHAQFWQDLWLWILRITVHIPDVSIKKISLSSTMDNMRSHLVDMHHRSTWTTSTFTQSKNPY